MPRDTSTGFDVKHIQVTQLIERQMPEMRLGGSKPALSTLCWGRILFNQNGATVSTKKAKTFTTNIVSNLAKNVDIIHLPWFHSKKYP